MFKKASQGMTALETLNLFPLSTNGEGCSKLPLRGPGFICFSFIFKTEFCWYMESAAIKAHEALAQGDDALYRGKWTEALNLYNEASELFTYAQSAADQPTQSMLQKQIDRCKEKVKQIQDYLESTSSIHLDSGGNWEGSELSPLTEYQSINEESLGPLPFGMLPTPKEEFIDSEASRYGLADVEAFLWKGLEKLFSYIPVPLSIQPAATDTELGLDSSFILLPNGTDSPNAKGERVVINLDKENLEEKEKEIERLRAEVQQLKLNNKMLQQTNSQLRKCNVSAGVQDLLQENVLLKKSIIGFRNQMHRQSSLWVQSGISQQAAMKSTGEPRPETEAAYLKRINSLEEIVRNLYQKLEAKETEVAKLNDYKEKYSKVKEGARRKKKERSSLTSSELKDKSAETGL